MSRHSLSAAAATLIVLSLASLAARAETVNQTLDGKALSIDLACVDRVEIQPKPGLSGKVVVEATSNKDGELKDFVFKGGETASVTRERRSCTSTVLDRPKTTVSIQVPAGTPIDIKNGGSTNYVVGAVGASLHARLAGSGYLTAVSATDVDIHVTGSSNVNIGQTNGSAEVQIAGSGDVRIGDAEMPSLKIKVSGSGNIAIDNGGIGTLTASVAGSGNLRVMATVQDATLSTVGSGNIEVAKVTGSLSSNKAGSGTIRAGRS
ncbi:hypothetical protein GCM10011611_49340 [Aliidongia dinghuensis]|uniref:Putative auto-transporter adhesin head GIN domain-containing protein n=1 Tax=Aliidongia dinghuensis TaxID=1867774 RepID=A0A8J3E613_9PROT|nr:DUF2807 domain-containing protein [Aliidongia dinghuensis]GGF36993.1 hypothetical protein GCM10011611_49340 [Aliidongia dinghuensis]